jgi:pimeloyl-ACP methyl ester carboxylesterase
MDNKHTPSRGVMTSIVFTAAFTIVLAAVSPLGHARTRAAVADVATKVATVKSKDGTTIAYERSGSGPVLVIVASALSDRSDARRLAALLAPKFTVINFDRRGRGESGDSPAYAVEREIEDIDALIEQAGGSAFVFGSSSGAVLALEASNKLASKVKAAVLFEPPFIVDDSRPPIPDDFFQKIDALVAAGRRSDALSEFMTRAIGVPEDMVAGMKQAPMWASMEKRVHTLLYDGAIMAGLQGGKPLPKKRWTSVTAPTLVLDGDQSPAYLRTAARALSEILPGSKRRTMEGRDHSAVFTAPEALAPVIVEFFVPAEPGVVQDKKSAGGGTSR